MTTPDRPRFQKRVFVSPALFFFTWGFLLVLECWHTPPDRWLLYFVGITATCLHCLFVYGFERLALRLRGS